MNLDFRAVSLEEKDKYYTYWQTTPLHSLDYTLANLWGWQEYYGMEWAFDNDLLWIRQTKPKTSWWAPLGNWHETDWQTCLMPGQHFTRVPEELLEIWRKAIPEKFEARDDRGQWEYLYSQQELATLPGNRFHKKRNHYNSYVKVYGEPDYRPISNAMIQDVLAVQDDWCHWHECDDSPSLRAENEAVNRVLCHWDSFRNMTGGTLYVDGMMVAFSIGEALDANNLGVHFEKGLGGFKGIYQAMNSTFARIAGNGFTWINRAQDLDEEGLRQAKMTYLPAAFLKKYQVTVL